MKKVDKPKRQCRECGSWHLVGIGYNVTRTGKRPRLKCQDCGATRYVDYTTK